MDGQTIYFLFCGWATIGVIFSYFTSKVEGDDFWEEPSYIIIGILFGLTMIPIFIHLFKNHLEAKKIKKIRWDLNEYLRRCE